MNLMEKYLTKLKQNERQNRPVREILSEKYNQFAEWLHQHDLTGDEIKETLPGLYMAIKRAIEDNAFYAEDLTAFQDALDRVKRLYQGAMAALKGGKLSYRIYSEILQSYLWVVETDKDMHSLRAQGITEAFYTGEEIRRLRGLSKDFLREIHKVKEIFKNSKVEKITTKENHDADR